MNFERDYHYRSLERVTITRNFNRHTQVELGLRNVIKDMVLLEPVILESYPRKTLVVAVDDIGKETCELLEGRCQKSQYIKSSRRNNNSLYEEQLYFPYFNATRFIFVGRHENLLPLFKIESFIDWARDQIRIRFLSSFNLQDNLIFEAKTDLLDMFVHVSYDGHEELFNAPEALATNIFDLCSILYPSSVKTVEVDIDEVFYSSLGIGFYLNQRMELDKPVEDLISLIKANIRLGMEAGVITEQPLDGVLISLGIPNSTLARWVEFETALFKAFAPEKGQFHCGLPAEHVFPKPFINCSIWML